MTNDARSTASTDPIEQAWADYWDHLESEELGISVCSACDAPNWYPAIRCRVCQGDEFRWVRLSGDGVLFMAMTVHRAFSTDGPEPPFDIALMSPVEYPDVRLIVHAPDAGAQASDALVHVSVETVQGRPLPVARAVNPRLEEGTG